MKKLVILLLIILFQKITCFSQTILPDSTVLITSEQLKKTNLIFAEHSKLLEENKLLYRQIDNFKLDRDILFKSDSIKSVQLSETLFKIDDMDKMIQKQDCIIKIGGIVVTFGVFLWLLSN